MFTEETVFVLGAGASWHYGYPTGEELVDQVLAMARTILFHCSGRIRNGQFTQHVPNYVANKINSPSKPLTPEQAWRSFQSDLENLISRLKAVRPLVIDYFLSWNESLRPIGKLVVAAVILECEAIWNQEQANQNRRLAIAKDPNKIIAKTRIDYDISKFNDNWYRFLIHKIVSNCNNSKDLLKNNVKFITFNYDNSLELILFKAFAAIDLFQIKDISSFLKDNRIVHMYGSIHEDVPDPNNLMQPDSFQSLAKALPAGTPFEPADYLLPLTYPLNRSLEASIKIDTIENFDKDAGGARSKKAREFIQFAHNIYIFGYGFDQQNNKRIGLTPNIVGTSSHLKKFLYTNYGNTKTIHRRAGPQQISLLPTVIRESSERNVYDAIAMDFDALD